MTQQNFQNNMYMPPVQSYMPVQNYLPVKNQVVPQLPQPVQTNPNNNYMPRFAPMVHQGQMYSVPIPEQQQPQKGGSVGTVNISINGVNPPGQQAPMPHYYPVPYYLPQYIPQAAPAPAPKEIPQQPIAASKIEKPQEEKQPAPPAKKPPVVELTDEYIIGLENNLRSGGKEVRDHAVAELVKRFKEDETRKDDIRLNKLLNLALQDDSKPVVFSAMQALNQGYASGDTKTVKLLQQISMTPDSFGNNETAREVLSNMAGRQNNRTGS